MESFLPLKVHLLNTGMNYESAQCSSDFGVFSNPHSAIRNPQFQSPLTRHLQVGFNEKYEEGPGGEILPHRRNPS
jgi:hypothetical protein